MLNSVLSFINIPNLCFQRYDHFITIYFLYIIFIVLVSVIVNTKRRLYFFFVIMAEVDTSPRSKMIITVLNKPAKFWKESWKRQREMSQGLERG